MCTDFFFPRKSFRDEIMPKNTVQRKRTQTIWRLRIAYWIRKPTRAQTHASVRASAPTNTRTHARLRMPSLTRAHTQKYVILTVFPRQQCFCERASLLRYSTLPVLLNVSQDLEECAADGPLRGGGSGVYILNSVNAHPLRIVSLFFKMKIRFFNT